MNKQQIYIFYPEGLTPIPVVFLESKTLSLLTIVLEF